LLSFMMDDCLSCKCVVDSFNWDLLLGDSEIYEPIQSLLKSEMKAK
jgi:hypothetical protein